MKRVLCFSPYSVWRPHNHWEGTILRALQVNGAHVKCVHCHGLAICDLEQAFKTGPARPCPECIAFVAQNRNEMNIDYELLGRYAPPNARQAALDWVAQLPPSTFPSAEYKDLQLGHWVRSSLHTRFRASTLDLEHPDIIKAYTDTLVEGAYVSEALSELFEGYRPDLLFLFNGRLSYTRIALEMAKARGIRTIVHEVGESFGSIMLSENETCLGAGKYHQMWSRWGDIPLIEDELTRTAALLEDRRRGKNLWVRFSSQPTQFESLYREVGLNGDRPIVALFTSSDDETAAAEDWREIFGSQLEWIAETVRLFAQLEDHDLVIRVHPNTGVTDGTGRPNQQLLDGISAITRTFPPNVRVVWPGDDVSTYTLMDVAKAGLSYGSTAGIEMASLGKPVVLSRTCWYYGVPAVASIRDVDDYPRLLISALGDTRPLGIVRSTYRLVYHAFIGMSIPFPLVAMNSAVGSRPAWHSEEDLRWGKEPGLDRILACILDDEDVYPGPTPEHLARGTQAEDKFFEKLLHLEALPVRV